MKVRVGSGGGCCQGGCCMAGVFLSPEAPTTRHSPWSQLLRPCQELETSAGAGGGFLHHSSHLPGGPSQKAHGVGLSLPPQPPPPSSPVSGKAPGAPPPHSQGPQRDPWEGPRR